VTCIRSQEAASGFRDWEIERLQYGANLTKTLELPQRSDLWVKIVAGIESNQDGKTVVSGIACPKLDWESALVPDGIRLLSARREDSSCAIL
jgi:hypothetical protein